MNSTPPLWATGFELLVAWGLSYLIGWGWASAVILGLNALVSGWKLHRLLSDQNVAKYLEEKEAIETIRLAAEIQSGRASATASRLPLAP